MTPLPFLLDVNCLLALLVPDHEHHDPAHRFVGKRPFWISTQVQLGVLRLLTRPRRFQGRVFPPLARPDEALRLTVCLDREHRARWLPDDLNCAGDVPFGLVTGHRQWNDFYLVALAKAHGLKLATFDRGVAGFFPEEVTLIPIG